MISIKDISTSELNSFVESETYKNFANLPISPQRALSHANNPRADREDKILFLAYDEDRFVGYLGALVDRFYYDDQEKKVAWLSCMWIERDYRRHGIALQLMNHAYRVWQGNLLITNFIPQSKAVFDKTGNYTDFKTLEGIRGYFRFNLSGILVKKKPALKKVKIFLQAADGILNAVNALRLLFYRNQLKLPKECQLEYVNRIDKETEHFIKHHNQKHLSRKSSADFDWMMKYPWVLNAPFQDNISRRYEFSSTDKNFRQLLIKVFNPEKRLIGFLMVNLKGSEMKTPFLYFEEKYTSLIRRVIYAHLLRFKASTLTTFHPLLVKEMRRKKRLLIMLRKFEQESIITQKLLKEISNPKEYYLMDGDGDCAFT
jgi:GNAT superfamily N-acetyltransferase